MRTRPARRRTRTDQETHHETLPFRTGRRTCGRQGGRPGDGGEPPDGWIAGSLATLVACAQGPGALTDDLEPVKQRLGVPFGKGSCHTAEVAGRFVEGHVPAGDIQRLLAANDGARGLVLPGMPLGSPGMEMPDGRVQA